MDTSMEQMLRSFIEEKAVFVGGSILGDKLRITFKVGDKIYQLVAESFDVTDIRTDLSKDNS